MCIRDSARAAQPALSSATSDGTDKGVVCPATGVTLTQIIHPVRVRFLDTRMVDNIDAARGRSGACRANDFD